MQQWDKARVKRLHLGERFLAELEQINVIIQLANVPADGGVGATGREGVLVKMCVGLRLPLDVRPVSQPCCHP